MAMTHMGAALAAGMMLASAPAWAQTAVAPAPTPAPRIVGVQGVGVERDDRLKGFSVVLVEGDLRVASASEGVPAAAAKALADLKDFLPYKSYRLIDTQWTLGSARVSTTLRGAAGQDYELTLAAQSLFSFTEVPRGAAPGAPRPFATSPPREPASKGTIFISKFDLRVQTAGRESETELRRRTLAPDHPDVLASRGTSLIDTSFRMDIGETVVVGTSRLQGDKALIVLLTAVGK